MPALKYRAAALLLCAFGAAVFDPVHAAEDWQDVVFTSSTVGNHTNRLCMGVPDYKRTSDIGCPSYAPSLSTAGHVSVSGNVSANKFIGDGSGLTNLTVQGDRITSDTHAAIINQNTGYVSLTTAGGTWGYFSAGWSYLANLFTNTVSSSLVSATNVSATYVDASRNGTVSATYGYFRYISGTDIHGRFTGDGSGLSGVIAGSSDRIVSGSTGGTRMVAISETGYISITQAGANSGWFDPYRGLVTLGVSATGGISGTSGYFSGGVGIGTAAPATNLEVSGSLRLSGAGTDTFITPLSIPLQTKISIPLFDPPAFGQIMVMGLGSTAPASARAFTFVDARTVAHQPTVGVLSPNESDLFGLSWDGLNTAAFIKSLGANIIIRANTTDIANFLASGEVGIGKSDPKAKLDVAGTISASDAIQVGASGLACGVGIPGAIRYNAGNIQYCNGASWVTLSGGGVADWYSISNIPAQVAAVSDGTVISMQTVSATALNAHYVSGTQGYFAAAAIVDLSAGGITANSVSSTRVSATNVSATFVDAMRNGTVSGTYGYFRFISGTDIFGRFMGDGSGLTGVTAAASDRIISGTNGATRMVAISETGYISMTQAGANSAWFDPYRGLVTLGVSATGPVSGTAGYFRDGAAVGKLNRLATFDVAGTISASDAIQVGASGLACGVGIPGAIRYNAGSLQYCNGASWVTLSGGGIADWYSISNIPVQVAAVSDGTVISMQTVSATALNAHYVSGTQGYFPAATIAALSAGSIGANSVSSSLVSATHVSATYVDATRNGTVSATYGYFRYLSGTDIYGRFTGDGSGLTNLNVQGDRIVSGTTNITAWQDNSLTFTTAGSDRMVIDGAGNMSFGVSYTAGTQRYYFYDEQQNKAAYRSFHVAPTFRSSTNGTYYNTGLLVSPAMEVASGVSNPGYVYGQWISAFRRDATDAGSLDALAGLVINTGHYQAVASARNTSVTTGLLIGMYAQNGNIPTMYGLRIVSRSGVYVTNSYGISQEGAHDRNYFAGNTGIGQGKANPVAKLDVAGTISLTDALQLGQNTVACASGVSGSIRYNTTSDTVQFCNGTSWTSLASGTTGGGTLSGTGSATAVAFWSGTNALTFSDGFYWDNNNKRLGIGKNNPSYALDISASGLSGIIVSNTSNGVTNASNLYLSRGDAANGYAGVVFATRGVDDWTLNVPAGGHDLRIWNNGAVAELVRFTTNGKVGIGTSSPSATLTVSGTISATNAIQVGTSTLTCGTPIAGALRYNSPNLQFCNGSTWTSIGGGGGGTVTGTGSATAVAFWSGASGLTYSDGFYWDNSNRRLGIGTNQPNAALVVSSTTSNLARFITNGDGINAVIEIQDASPGQQRLAAINFLNGAGLSKGQVAYASGYNYMVFRTNSAERVRIVSTGEVGIGTQSPTATLQVSGTLLVSSAAPSLYVDSIGRVAVGTLSPLSAFHVSGTVSVTNALQLGQNTITCATGVSGSIRYNTTSNTVQFCNGSGWVSLSSGTTGGVSALASLTDVTLTNLAGRDYLRYDTVAGKWVNISESTAMSTTTMVAGWPDAILCSASGKKLNLYAGSSPDTDGRFYYYETGSTAATLWIGFNADGTYYSQATRDYTDCKSSISAIYADGRAFNFIGNANAGITAQGDRITSGTLAMVANSATSYVSLSTNGTTWGYFNSGNSYLPKLSTMSVSGTYLQLSSSSIGIACNSAISGTLRNSSGTIQVCDGTSWGSLAGVAALASLTDVQLTNLAGRDYLRYDSVAGKWVNISESTVMSTTTMVAGVPDAIICTESGVPQAAYLTSQSGSTVFYRLLKNTTGDGYISYNSGTGAYISHNSMSSFDCVTNAWSISQLYASGKAFNFIGNSSLGGSALGDRITSGTLAVVANSATSYVSLSTNGMDWGYLSGGLSYLPTLGANRVSSTNVSASVVQLRGTTVTAAGGAANYIVSGTARVSVSSAGVLTFANGGTVNLLVDNNGNVGVGASTTLPLSGSKQVIGGFGATQVGGATNWNDASNARSGNGATLLLGSATNGPGGNFYYHPFSFEYSSKDGTGNMTQLAIAYGESTSAFTNGAMFMRGRYAGSWTGWYKFTTTAVSDYRAKEHVTPLAGGLEKVMALRPIHFDYKKGHGTTGPQDGFYAHELAGVAPYAVTGTKDQVDESGNPQYQSIDLARLTPLLASAVQQLKHDNDNQQAKIIRLEEAVQELRGAVDRLQHDLQESRQATHK